MPTIRITHPAAITPAIAKAALFDLRRWRIHRVGGVEVELDPRRPGWKSLDALVYLEPGRYTLATGPKAKGVRAPFEVLSDGTVVPGPGAGKLAARFELPKAAGAPAIPAAKTAPRGGSTKMTGDGGTVSTIAAERIAADQAHLKAHGIALPPPVYTAGTRVVELGRSNFRASHQEWAGQAPVVEGLQGIIDAVRSEDRQDVAIDARGDLRMRDDGSLAFGSEVLALEEVALKGLAGLFGDTLPGAGRLLTVLDPERRARLVNEQIERSARIGEGIKLRTRMVNGTRQVFALVGPNYGSCDADKLAELFTSAIRSAGMDTARGEVTYNPTTTDLRVNALWHADHVVDLAAGDVFKAGINFRANDAGGGSIQGRVDFWRNRCLNLIIIGKGSAPLFRVVHRGSMRKVQTRIRQGLKKAEGALNPFLNRWGYLRQTEVMDFKTIREAIAEAKPTNQVQTAKTALGALLDMKLAGVDWPVRRDAMVEMALRGWQAEPGLTLADMVNAITRVHEEGALLAPQLEAVETSAGALMNVLAASA